MADDDKVFLITGASTGIGAATARQAVEAGYRVVLSARSADKLEALAAELGRDGRALAVPADVGVWEDNEALARRALERFERIDVVFANAGFGGARGFQSSTPEEWKAMVLTNVLGAALTIRATQPHLIETKGHLLLTSSVAGRRALPGSFYSVTKHAVTAMGEAARLDFDDTGVRVTLIEPGIVDTPFFDDPPEIRALDADDVARAIMFAVSQPPHVDINEILIRPTAQPT
jgi:NADP-dependent 3-hydroxy acid dehydrogenase YdfG